MGCGRVGMEEGRGREGMEEGMEEGGMKEGLEGGLRGRGEGNSKKVNIFVANRLPAAFFRQKRFENRVARLKTDFRRTRDGLKQLSKSEASKMPVKRK